MMIRAWKSRAAVGLTLALGFASGQALADGALDYAKAAGIFGPDYELIANDPGLWQLIPDEQTRATLTINKDEGEAGLIPVAFTTIVDEPFAITDEMVAQDPMLDQLRM